MNAKPFLAATTLLLAPVLLGGCGAEDTTPEVSIVEPVELISTSGAYHVQVVPEGGLKVGKNKLRASFLSPRTGTITSVSALMPSHGHGTQGAKVTRVASDYIIEDISMFMSGKWEIKLALGGGAQADELRFYVDVP